MHCHSGPLFISIHKLYRPYVSFFNLFDNVLLLVRNFNSIRTANRQYH